MMTNYANMAREADALKDSGQELEGLVPVKARVARDVRAVFSLRLAPNELVEISNAAKAKNMAVGDFIRTAALAAADGNISPMGRRRLKTELKPLMQELEAKMRSLSAGLGELLADEEAGS